MSDAREIVQPRWKRRATEIAEAIGGNTSGVSSVSLDSNTITELSQAIADAIDLKVLDINIRKYDDNFVSSSGIPIRTGVGVASGQFMPLRVRTEAGDKVDVNIKQFNDVDVDSRGVPVQAGRTTTNNTLVPLVVNCPTINNFPTGGGAGGGGLNITDTTTAFQDALYGVGVTAANKNLIHSVEVGTSNAINTTLRNPNFPLPVDLTRIRGTNVATSPAGVGSHLPIVTYSSALSVTETNPVSGSGGGTSLTQQQVETAMDNALANATGISVTETTPVNAVAVNNHPTSTSITGTVSVTETNPVSGGGGAGTSLTQQQVETAMGNALANATGISVTASIPSTVSTKLVGDETYGIIMSKTYYVSGNTVDHDYQSISYGLGVSSYNSAKQGIFGSVYTHGWIIRVNGFDIHNQDISFGLRGATPIQNNQPGNLTTAQAYPWYIPVDSQATVDKYHARKVTLSAVANVWIVEPFTPDDDVEYLGTIVWSSTTGIQINADDGTHYTDQIAFTSSVIGPTQTWINHSNWSNNYAGLRVSKSPQHGANSWLFISVGIH